MNVLIIGKLGIFLSLLASGLWLGCSGDHTDSEGSGYGHYHAAPHGGSLAMLGDHLAQLELVEGPNPENGVFMFSMGERSASLESSKARFRLRWMAIVVVFQAVANPATGDGR